MNEQMIRKNNMKIYPAYKMFAWDLLFFYAIIFLFLTQVKGLTAAEVLFADSFYAIFRVVFQIFGIKIVDSIGKQKSLLLGNLFVTISILGIILCDSILFLIFLYFIQAMGYNLKGLCEPTLLHDSIPESSSASKIYSKIDGKGNSYYYIFDAISSVATGFLYVINPYVPLILCFVCSLISTILTLSFNDIRTVQTEKSTGFIEYYKDILVSFRQIMKSSRLRSLFLFSSCFGGILSVFGTLRSSILVDIGLPEQYFGIIIAAMQIISSFTSLKQYYFHKKLRNRALSFFALSITTSFILLGLIVVCNISFMVSLISCLIAIMLYGFIKGPYYTLMQRYLNSFSNSNINTKIFAIDSLLYNLGRVLLSFFASFLLSVTTTSYTFIIIGCLFFTIFIFLLDYMKTKVGLKPEEYPEEDLIFSDEK